MVLDKFNVQWSSSCKTKDYLYVGKISKYTKIWLCGSSIPNNFNPLKSKKSQIVIKFHSDKSTRKSGFKARFIGKIYIIFLIFGINKNMNFHECFLILIIFSHWIISKSSSYCPALWNPVWTYFSEFLQITTLSYLIHFMFSNCKQVCTKTIYIESFTNLLLLPAKQL